MNDIKLADLASSVAAPYTQRYLKLMPNAANTRAAQGKVCEWTATAESVGG